MFRSICVLKPYRPVDNTNTSSGERHENGWAAAVVGITMCRTWRSSLPAKLLHTGAPQRERLVRKQRSRITQNLNRNKWMYVWWKYWSGQTTFSKGPAQWMDNYRGQLPDKRAAPVCMFISFTNVCRRIFARHIHIYVCMYVCMYVCTYSMYLRICVSLGECMYVCR